MADKTSLVYINIDTNGKTLQKTVTDINPEAGGGSLREFTQMLTALTKNVYAGSSRIDKTDLQNATDPVQKKKATVTLAQETWDVDTALGTSFARFTYDGDADYLYVIIPDTTHKYVGAWICNYDSTQGTGVLRFGGSKAQVQFPIEIIVVAPETDTCLEARATFTITEN